MKPTILETRYVLAVQDLKASANYYIEKLGFSTEWAFDGWHKLHRDGIYIMLGECSDDVAAFDTRNHSYFAYIMLNGIDELFQEYVAKGVNINMHLQDKPWGMREFGIQTIDGHRIMFGQEIGGLEV